MPLALFLLGNVLFGSGLFFHSFLYNFYLEALGLPPEVMGHAAAMLTAGGLASLIPAGRLADRVPPGRVVFVAAVVCASGLTAGAFATTRPMIYATAFLAGLGTGSWRVATSPILMELTEEGNRPRVFAWNVGLLVTSGAAFFVTAGNMPTVLGHALSLDQLHALRAAMLMGAGGTALSLACFLTLVSRPRAPAPTGSPSQGLSLGSWREMIVLVSFVALWMTGPALVGPFFNLFFSRVHAIPVERIGWVFAASQVVAGVAVFAGGELSSRVGARRALVTWVVVFAPILWALALAPTIVAIGLYLVLGIVSPATNALIDQLLMERAAPDRRGALSAWRNAATEASGAMGASLGGAILGATSFPTLFGYAGLVGLAGGLALLLGLARAGTRRGTVLA